MGGIAAGNLLAFWEGKQTTIRETCGTCVLEYEIRPYLLPSEI